MDQIGSYVYLLYNSFPVQLLFTQCKDILHIFLPLLRHFEVRYSFNKSPGFPRLGFSSKAFCHSHFDFWVIYLLLQKENMIFFFFGSALAWICVKRLPPGVAAPLRPGAERGCVGRRNHKRLFRFPGFPAVLLNHTTYPAVSSFLHTAL